MPREPLAVQNNSRDAARRKDSWGTNCFIDGAMARGRPGAELLQEQDKVGLGLANFQGKIYSFGDKEASSVSWIPRGYTLGVSYTELNFSPSYSVIVGGGFVWLLQSEKRSSIDTTVLYKAAVPYSTFTEIAAFPRDPVEGHIYSTDFLLWSGTEVLLIGTGELLAYSPNSGTFRTVLTASAVATAQLGSMAVKFDGFVYTTSWPGDYRVVRRSADFITWETVYSPSFTVGSFLLVANGKVYTDLAGGYPSSAVAAGTGSGTWEVVFTPETGEQLVALQNCFLGFYVPTGNPVAGTGTVYSFSGEVLATFETEIMPANSLGMYYGALCQISFLLDGQVYIYLAASDGGGFKPYLSNMPGTFVYNIKVSGATPYSVVPGYAGFFIKNETNAYWFDGTTFTLITDANYPTATVPGAVFLDGTYYVMDSQARIWGCKTLNDATVWDPLNVLTATSEPDGGVAIARQLQYIVAFGAYTTEFFYDAGNATGSPLLPYSSALLELGCANGYSVAQSDNQTIFIGVSKQKGRSIYRLTGTTPDLLSTPAIDRVITADDLSDVSSFCVRITGANFYVLTLGQSGVTLACDLATKDWKEWTSLTAGTALNLARLDYANGIVMSSGLVHGLQNGDPVLIAGAGDAAYDGYYLAAVSSPTVFSYTPLGVPLVTSVISAGTVTPFSSGPFVGRAYTGFGVWDLVQSSNGSLYSLSTDYTTDGQAPIDIRIRTAKIDAGSDKRGFTGPLEIIGDKVTALAYLRYSGDDYQTWSNWRPVQLGTKRSQLNRLGSDRRRAYELRCIADAEVRFEALELDLTKGVS